MTKREALAQFNETIKPMVLKTYGKNDKPAMCEEWNVFTDSLCKGGLITLKQYESWTNPF